MKTKSLFAALLMVSAFAFAGNSEPVRTGMAVVPVKGSEVYSSTPGKSKMILRNPYFGAGFEYAFTLADKKKRMWIPFIGAEFLLNIILNILSCRHRAGGELVDTLGSRW